MPASARASRPTPENTPHSDIFPTHQTALPNSSPGPDLHSNDISELRIDPAGPLEEGPREADRAFPGGDVRPELAAGT